MLQLILIEKNPLGQLLKALSLLLGGNGWTRTNHTQIFSLLLYLMSYVALLVLSTRIELVFYPYQGHVMPLYYESKLVRRAGIEPTF